MRGAELVSTLKGCLGRIVGQVVIGFFKGLRFLKYRIKKKKKKA